MTFELGWHGKVKSRSFGVHWAVHYTQCIIRQWSCQAERPLVGFKIVKREGNIIDSESWSPCYLALLCESVPKFQTPI